MLDLAALYARYSERKAFESAKHGHWRSLARIYDGELVIPNIETDDIAEAAVPNLIAQGIDFYSRTFASTQPDVDCPAVRPNIRKSREQAADRVRAIKGWWQGSSMSLADYQRGRFYFGYGAMPVIVRPGAKRAGVPWWDVKNPHTVLPGPKAQDYLPDVPDAFVSTLRSAKWARDAYGVDFGQKVGPDRMVELVEYVDAEQVTVFCVGPASPDSPGWLNDHHPNWLAGPSGWTTSWNYGSEIIHRRIERISGGLGDGGWLVGLSSTPNYAGVCTVSCPGAISLSKVRGLVDGILSKHRLQAKLMSLTVKQIAKGIHPNEWVELDPQEGEVVRMADGLRGIVGEIRGGRMTQAQVSPGYMTLPFLDRLESYQRGEAGISPEFGGESGTNIRTGRRGEQIQATTVDPVVREAHEIAQVAREHEIRLAVAVAKGYGGSRPVSFYVTEGRSKNLVTFKPSELFETDEATVRYPVTGMGASALIIEAGQSIGTEMMSKHDARVINPLVEDVDATEARIRAERAEGSLFAALDQIALASPEDAAFITREFRKGSLPEDVFEAVQRRVQERQATAGEQGAPDGPAAPGSPEAQAGLGAAGVADAPVVAEPPASLRNLALLFQNTRAPSRTVPAERAG